MRRGARGCRLLTAAVVLLAAGGVARGEGRPGYGGDVSGSLLGAPSTLDPASARTHAEVTVATLLFDPLYRLGADGSPHPHLAVALPVLSEDGLTATIEVRQGVHFHDGAVMTAMDVAKSLARAMRAPTGWLLAPLAAVRVDGEAVVVELRRETPELATLLAAPTVAITPDGAAPRGSRAVGTGPYRLTRFEPGKRRLVLSAAEQHFAGRPYVDRVELRWYEDPDEEARVYEAGDAHLSFRGAVAFAGHEPKYATDDVEGPASVLAYVGFGAAHAAITENLDFRRALSLSLARRGFRSVGTGERVVPAVHPAPYDLGGPVLAAAAHDARISEARRALARARRQVPALGTRGLRLAVIIDRSRPDDRALAERVVAALYRLGVGADIEELAPARFAERLRKGAFDLAIGQLAFPLPIAELAAAAAFATVGDRTAERLLRRGPLSLPAITRAFEERLPVIPLLHRSVRVHHRRDVRGVVFDALGRLAYADLFLHGSPRGG